MHYATLPTGAQRGTPRTVLRVSLVEPHSRKPIGRHCTDHRADRRHPCGLFCWAERRAFTAVIAGAGAALLPMLNRPCELGSALGEYTKQCSQLTSPLLRLQVGRWLGIHLPSECAAFGSAEAEADLLIAHPLRGMQAVSAFTHGRSVRGTMRRFESIAHGTHRARMQHARYHVQHARGLRPRRLGIEARRQLLPACEARHAAFDLNIQRQECVRMLHAACCMPNVSCRLVCRMSHLQHLAHATASCALLRRAIA